MLNASSRGGAVYATSKPGHKSAGAAKRDNFGNVEVLELLPYGGGGTGDRTTSVVGSRGYRKCKLVGYVLKGRVSMWVDTKVGQLEEENETQNHRLNAASFVISVCLASERDLGAPRSAHHASSYKFLCSPSSADLSLYFLKKTLHANTTRQPPEIGWEFRFPVPYYHTNFLLLSYFVPTLAGDAGTY